MAGKRFMTLMLLLIIAACLPGAGCGDGFEQDESPGVGTPAGNAASSTGRVATMNGRSVMGAWMEHWGYDWSGPVEKWDTLFDYRELDASDLDRLPNSFSLNVEGLNPGSVTFFKLCFVDFYGDNERQLEGIIDAVVEKAEEKVLRLIIGNALPVRRQDGSGELLAQYDEFNGYLERKAEERPGVWIFDLYGVLSGPDGFLQSGYDTGDSHINEKGYRALDETFFPLLEAVFME